MNVYVCGPTVYASPHIGNMRPILVYDIFLRAQTHLGKPVYFIHNLTDIDDKIIAAATQQGISEARLATTYTAEYLKLLRQFNIRRPNRLPKVTTNINKIIRFINKLLASGAAYVSDNSVYFDINSTKGYGMLSHQNLAEMHFEQGAHKRHPADFALWKKTTVGVQFDSPWGQGRPGWHTECAAFIDYFLKGAPLDYHGGGIDLLFPHHENENIQYLAANRRPIAKSWQHVGHLFIRDEKMSKSLHNEITATDFINLHGADALRYLFFSTAIQSPVSVDEVKIAHSKAMVAKFNLSYNRAFLLFPDLECQGPQLIDLAELIAKWDFAAALAKIHEIYKLFINNPSRLNAQNLICAFKIIGFKFSSKQPSKREHNLYNSWEELKQKKDFAAADLVRAKLQQKKLI